MPELTYVDIAFPARGQSLPLDHGYALFSALSRIVPALHAEMSWGIHPVLGTRQGETLKLDPRSRVKIRMPLSEISQIMLLSGATVEVCGSRIEFGFPQVRPLTPAAHLKARIVTIRGFEEPKGFMSALRRQLEQLDGLGQEPGGIELVVGQRRVLVIQQKKVVGFAVGMMGLGADGSLAVQTEAGPCRDAERR